MFGGTTAGVNDAVRRALLALARQAGPAGQLLARRGATAAAIGAAVASLITGFRQWEAHSGR